MTPIGAPLLLHLTKRLVQNFENELRTEALLAGERYYEYNKFVALLKPRRKIGYTREQAAKALGIAEGYGMNMQRISVRPTGKQLRGIQPTIAVLDDYAKVDLLSLEDLILSSTKPPEQPQGAPLRAEPNRGPQPRKPHIYRRKK